MIERKASIAVASVTGCLLAPALLAAIWMAVQPVLQSSPWADLWQDPRTFDALTATLCTSIAASLLAWCSSAYLLRQAFIGGQSGRWLNRLPPLLATPHAAMAIAVVPVLGALLCGAIQTMFPVKIRAHGVSSVLYAIHRRRSQLPGTLAARTWLGSTPGT